MAKDLVKKKISEEQRCFRQIISDYYSCGLNLEGVGNDISMFLEVLEANKQEPREIGMILALKNISGKYKEVVKAYSQLSLALETYRQEFFSDELETV